ncbi:hypothetical protein AAFP35_17685 [Gordonia sp. CPCC 206044]|uniref:hypothetical protein n=1 Tax=Gordonia sp. CPCC 206044 TaxID=3140793 RepID=UPI003AF3A07B
MTTTSTLPQGFHDLEPFVDAWASETRQERYDTRMALSIDALDAFYDVVAPRAEEAIEHLNGFDLAELPEAETRLLRLMYSLIMVSYPVNVFRQPRIPDSGAAFFDTVVEPGV